MSEYDTNYDGVEDTVMQDTHGDGVADVIGYDADQNGVVEQMSVDTNNDSVLDTYAYDTNQNGIIDTVLVDENQDGYTDSVITDMNENGRDDADEARDPTGLYPSSTIVGGAPTYDGVPGLLIEVAEQTGNPTFGTPQSDSDGVPDAYDSHPTDSTRY